MQGGSLVSLGRVLYVPLSFPVQVDLSDKAALCLLTSFCEAAEATGEITRESRRVPGCWLGIEGRGALQRMLCKIMHTELGSLPRGDSGRLFQVSKLCGSKFQAAFRLQKHFQIPAVASDLFLPGDPRAMKQYETARFTMFWDYILRDESPASVCPGPVSAPPNPASPCNSCSEIRKAFDKIKPSKNPKADWALQRITAY